MNIIATAQRYIGGGRYLVTCQFKDDNQMDMTKYKTALDDIAAYLGDGSTADDEQQAAARLGKLHQDLGEVELEIGRRIKARREAEA